EPSQRPRDDESPAAAGAQESHAGRYVAAGVAALVALVALLPTVVRRRRRRTRLRRASPEDLWAELRDTSVDLGMVWPEGASIRSQAATVHVSEDADRALGRLVGVMEEARYSPREVEAGASGRGDDLRAVTRALHEAAGPRAKRWARVFPRSLIR
ncbi:MAG: hypothetical protein QM572_07565, partial [Nocardioides sp.]